MTQDESAAEKERRVTKAVASDIASSETGVITGSTVNIIKERNPDMDLVDIRIFGRVCQARGIDPLVGDLYAMVYNKENPRGGPKPRTLVLVESIDSMRKRGHATGLVRDMDGPEFCGPDGVWTSLWLKEENPVAARFGIWKRGMDRLIWHTRLWGEVAKKGVGDEFWRSQPTNMLGIAAERHAWRKTVPNLFAGMYGEEELPANTGNVTVEQLPADLAPELLGEVVADADGVIDGESPPPTDDPEPEGDATEGRPGDAEYDMQDVFRALWTRMKDSTPSWEWKHLASITGWPEGADREAGVRALLAGAIGSEDELADMIFSALEATRS